MSWFRRAAADDAPVIEKGTAAATSTTSAILIAPDGRPSSSEYDAAQQAMHLKEYSATLLLPDTDDYHVWEKRFLDDSGTHERYCRAAKWRLDDAQKRIKETLEWRREFKPELITLDEVRGTASTGKLLLNGFDREGHPIIYMRPGRGPPPDHDKQVRYLIFLLERAIDLMPEGQEQLCIIVDYHKAGQQPPTPFHVSRNVLHILQRHYVERLGRALVINFPWIINVFLKAIWSFLDPVTQNKVRFSPELIDFVAPEQLEAEYPGGKHAFKLDIDTYFADLTNLCCLSDCGGRHWDGNPWVPPSGRGIAWAKEQQACLKEKSPVQAMADAMGSERAEVSVDACNG